jgi:hypothetical protein
MNKKELRQIIKEALDSSSDIYITRNVDVDVYLNSKDRNDDYFTSDSKATIYWSLNLEKESHGITGVFPVIKKIELFLEMWKEDKQEYEKTKKVIDNINVTDGDFINGLKLVIENNGEQGHIFPTSLTINELNENDKRIELIFDMP